MTRGCLLWSVRHYANHCNGGMGAEQPCSLPPWSHYDATTITIPRSGMVVDTRDRIPTHWSDGGKCSTQFIGRVSASSSMSVKCIRIPQKRRTRRDRLMIWICLPWKDCLWLGLGSCINRVKSHESSYTTNVKSFTTHLDTSSSHALDGLQSVFRWCWNI